MPDIDRILSFDKIPNKKSQEQTIVCKKMYSGSKRDRYEIFKKEFVDPETDSDMQLPIQNYFPTPDYRTIISELSEAFPHTFQSTGKQSDMVKEALIENSHFRRSYSEIAKECILAPTAFVVPKVKFDTNKKNKEIAIFDLQVLPYEECFDWYDEFTGELNLLVWQRYEEEFDVYGNAITVRKKTTYTMNKIYIQFEDHNGKRVAGLENYEIDNPFLEYDIFPVLVFESIFDRYDTKNGIGKKPIAFDLVETQLQIENLNYNIENGINFHGSPAYKVTNSLGDWTEKSISPNDVITCLGDEDIDVIGGTINVSGLDVHMDNKVDKFYAQAGLVPPSKRDNGTDSSAVAKLQQSPLINKIKIIMSFHKKPMNQLAKMILLINGFEYSDERVMPPEEILPINLQEILATWSIGMNLGLLDDEAFWKKYFPEFTKEDKDRIRKFYEHRFVAGNLDPTNGVNLDNKSKPTGNKKSASMTKEERDLDVTQE